jgi:DNA-binding MarR family transcriptional regulator
MVEYFKAYYENKDGEHWFEKRGAMWPNVYLDSEKGIKACFTIQMHKGGRFIIPFSRDLNFHEFFQDFFEVFSKFLSEDEVELLLKWLFEQGGKENQYIHEAHAIEPDEIVEKRLNGAKLHIKILGPEEIKKFKVYVDKSKNYEFEGEGDAVKVRDYMDISILPTYVTGSLASIDSELGKLDRYNSHTLENQGVLFSQQQLLQKDQEFYFNELDSKLGQQHEIIRTFPELHEENLVISRNILGNLDRFNQNQKILADSMGDVVRLTNNQTDMFDQQITQVENNIIKTTKQDTDLILASISDMKEDLKKEFDNLRNAVLDQIESSHTEFKNNLYLVLRAIKQIPGATSKELVDLLKHELEVSQTTIYKYFNRLQEEGFIESNKFHNNEKGRPSRMFHISKKIKNLIKKI